MLFLSNHSFLGKFSKGLLTKYPSWAPSAHIPQPHAHIFVNHSKVFSLYWKHLPCEEDSFPQLKKDPSADHTHTFSHLNTKIISALCWGKTGFHRPTPLGYLMKACSHRPPLILGPTHLGYHPQGYGPQIFGRPQGAGLPVHRRLGTPKSSIYTQK
jgi:hypothetical protein